MRPQQFTELAAAQGEEWAVDYAKKIAANKPKWMSSGTAALTLMVAGEILLPRPTSYGTWYRQASRNPNFPVGWVFPEGPILGDQKSTSEPGQRRSQCQCGDTICRLGREQRTADPLTQGVKVSFTPRPNWPSKSKGRTIKVADWDVVAQAERVSKRIVEIWGFPRAEKSKAYYKKKKKKKKKFYQSLRLKCAEGPRTGTRDKSERSEKSCKLKPRLHI